jgi:hypothetical protein
MQALLARRRQALPPPRQLAPHINLQHAITHMPNASPEDITQNLTSWYEILEGNEPNMGPIGAAQLFATMNAELRSNGNQHGMGPQFLLYNTGGNQFNLISCLFERPEQIPDMPAESQFSTAPFIAVLENRDNADEDWLYGPISANELFAKRTHKLGTWDAIKIPIREQGVKHGLAVGRNTVATDFFPVLPLFGQAISTAMVELLYPAQDQDRPTVKAVAWTLKPYVESIMDPTTKALAQASLLGMVTKAGPDPRREVTQAGTMLINTEEGAFPAIKAALKN